MKKVIEKKMYNTETAELIHSWDNGLYGNDFGSCEEILYLTKKGTYFIAGSGGAKSKYATSYGNSTGGGESIEIVSKSEAIEWLESHDGAEVLEKNFSSEIEEG